MKYRTIVADPPWDYTGTSFREGAGDGVKYANKPLPYATATVDAIAAMRVEEVADDNAGFKHAQDGLVDAGLIRDDNVFAFQPEYDVEAGPRAGVVVVLS